MQTRKVWTCLTALLVLLCLVPAAAGAQTLRGYEKGEGWNYVHFGEYPYEKDGTVAPVLWRVLDVTDNQALMLTEYVIDTQQVIFETDKKKIEKHDYRRISSYEESDLYTWLNTEALDTLLGDDPARNALIDEPGAGKLFVPTRAQFLNPDYGFSSGQWNDQPTRYAKGTPYAIKVRGLYVGEKNNVCYWAAYLRAPEGYHMQLVGFNGHLSWGAYTRVNVGLRLAVRLDMNQMSVSGGAGTKDEPFRLAYTGSAEPAAEAAPQPLQVITTVPVMNDGAALVVEAPTAEVPVAEAPVEEAPVEEAPVEEAPAQEVPVEEVPAEEVPAQAAESSEALLSFVGDCSIGDAYQFAKYSSSYHATIDEKGYAWPFSLVKDYLASDDLTVANLEVVFTERTSHVKKDYPLVGAPDHVQVLLEGSVEIVNTVNNHCMDFKNGGYEDTLEILDNAGVARFGSVYPGQKNGHDDLAVKDVNGIRFGFLGFSYPQEYDKKKIANRITKLREEENCDVVIVSLHWGRETHPTPTSGQVSYAKKVIDSGADAIWGHHAHVIQPIQFYKGKPILYSTGNFTFGTMSNVDPATGIFQMTWEKVDDTVQLKKLQVIPCRTQGNPDYRPYELTEEADRREVFRKLVLKTEYKNCVNPPDSFLETGVINFENGEMLP